jgi:hypothetical protein
MSIITFKEKWDWYTKLIEAGCPDHLLSVAFYIATKINGQPESDVYGKAYPNLEEIIAATGKKADRVSAITKVLHDQGWMIKDVNQRRTGRKTFYTLTIGEAWEAKTRAVSEKSLANLNPSRMVSEEVTPKLSEQPTPNVSEEPSRMVSDDKSKPEKLIEESTEKLTRASAPGGFSIAPKDEASLFDKQELENSIGKEDVPSISDGIGVAPERAVTSEPVLYSDTQLRVMKFRKDEAERKAKLAEKQKSAPRPESAADNLTQEEREDITW